MPEAYLILAHQSDDCVLDLFRLIHHPANFYLIHVDRKAPRRLHDLAAALAAHFANTHCLDSRFCGWGGYSLVETTQAGIATALAASGDWGHFILLSERHLPLLTPLAVHDALTQGVSEIDMMPAAAMHPHAQADLLDRFAMRYRELPGVGSFGTAPIPASLDGIFHGSQWVILDRGLCDTLADPANAPLWRRFAASLLADETAIQTIAAQVEATGARIIRRNRTWIASPERSGNNDLIFTEANFAAASRDGDYFFIRKRPHVLPEAVAQAIETRAGFGRADLAALAPRPVAQPAAPAREVADLVLQLRAYFGIADRRLTIRSFEAPENGVKCYIEFVYPDSTPLLTLCLLSEDMTTYKIVLALHIDFDGDYQFGACFGFPTSVIRARVFGLGGNREIHLGASVDHGFVTLRDRSDLSPLLASLQAYLRVFAEMSRLSR